ncbi:hypothetical protein [Granulicella tundricola]|uniref:Uncharacterized protein n=1 Tax=Granulicella tundricola (strain ATCC BAA-1859 / DSM 23138 / MP5ACTX9) TaxID=1198114 RepID=E8X260_GRATM|nr:hypothetical protein [Granulicella tundricola]ADW70303.1 hypothetical protein AciX9_3292 [Granulicella tundricola MP5ACTX9]
MPLPRLAIFVLLLIGVFRSCFAQAAMRPCAPAAEQTDDPGPACFTAKEEIGELPGGSYFWHLYTFPDRATAEAAKGRTLHRRAVVWQGVAFYGG